MWDQHGVRVVVWFVRFMGIDWDWASTCCCPKAQGWWFGMWHSHLWRDNPNPDKRRPWLHPTIAPEAGCKRPRPGQNCWLKPWTLHYTLGILLLRISVSSLFFQTWFIGNSCIEICQKKGLWPMSFRIIVCPSQFCNGLSWLSRAVSDWSIWPYSWSRQLYYGRSAQLLCGISQG